LWGRCFASKRAFQLPLRQPCLPRAEALACGERYTTAFAGVAQHGAARWRTIGATIAVQQSRIDGRVEIVGRQRCDDAMRVAAARIAAAATAGDRRGRRHVSGR
jgi:hypothetical protein